jgi:hypothetical protein
MKNKENTTAPVEGKATEPRGRWYSVYRHITDTLGAILFLLPLAFIFDLAGYIPPHLRLFAIYTLLALPLCRYPRASVLRGGTVLAAAILLNAFAPLPQAAEVLLLTFTHLWVWSPSGVISGWLAQGIAFYAVLHLFLFQSPLGYSLLEGMNHAVIWFGQWVTGRMIRTGYTYQNIGSLMLFLTLSVHAWDRGILSKARTALFLLIILLLNGLLSAVLLTTVDIGADLTWDLQFRDLFSYRQLVSYATHTIQLIFPIFIFFAHAATYLILHHDAASSGGRAADEAPKTAPRKWLPWVWIGLTALLLLIMLPPTSMRPARTRKISFLHRGVVSFSKPNYERYSRAAGGMFGFLPEYAQLFGCDSEVVSDIPDPLNPDQILVMTNLDEPLSSDEFERIWSFVRAGGGLWVLGDHTFIKNGRNHINDLLMPTNIRLNHDSAQFHPQGWFNSYRIRQGTAFSWLRDEPAENRLSILVGCSLDLTPPARPLILGRFGFGDWGPAEEDEERGWLGDFEYQVNERLGDLVLVAGEQIGEGKVLVFGDTSSFFNLTLTRSYELLRAVLTWFGEPAFYTRAFSRSTEWLSLLLLLLALSASLFNRSSDRPAVYSLTLLALLSLVIHQGSVIAFDRNLSRKRMAIIDHSLHPYASKHAIMRSGLFGVTASFMRHDLMPVTQKDWSRALLDEASLLFLNAPQRPFSAKQQKDVMDFTERGGIVLMACGYPHYGNVRSFLQPLGMEVLNVPLGRSFDRLALGRPIHLFSAWPIRVTRTDASILALYDTWPLIVEVPIGHGRFVLIADSEFFHNINLENLEQHSQVNVDFLRNLLDRLRGDAAP